MDLTVRSVWYIQDRSAIREVVYRAGDSRCTALQFDIESSDASRVTDRWICLAFWRTYKVFRNFSGLFQPNSIGLFDAIGLSS
jgi:hypothetical protein